MGGIFGVISKNDCSQDLFYGTDYHSHLGTKRGGLTTLQNGVFTRFIHNIENTQFRSKFEDDIHKLKGTHGIGCISDNEDQPVLIGSHMGRYAIVTVGRVNNIDALVYEAFRKKTIHFSEMSAGEINPTELFATLINEGATFDEGIRHAQHAIDGSCTCLILTDAGLYAARDRFGRTPLIIGKKKDAFCATLETCAFPNLGFRFHYELGPGEVVLITPEGIEKKQPSEASTRICSFLWVYYGFPSSNYEGINVEAVRYRCGAALARKDDVSIDYVAGIPDSGSAHAIGYANAKQATYARPFVKYTPTWPRSFMPQDQDVRNLVARMKLTPIRDLIDGNRLLFCEDSIVRGTQLRETIQRLYDHGAKEVHMRPACPPLIYGCRFLNFSRSKSELDLAGRKAIQDMGADGEIALHTFSDVKSPQYRDMVERIRERLNLTTLKYQRLEDLVHAIGLPKTSLCTYCWDGSG